MSHEEACHYTSQNADCSDLVRPHHTTLRLRISFNADFIYYFTETYQDGLEPISLDVHAEHLEHRPDHDPEIH